MTKCIRITYPDVAHEALFNQGCVARLNLNGGLEHLGYLSRSSRGDGDGDGDEDDGVS